ncbi:MAG TPA: hypothetical protein VNO32_56845 [Candidatus Acidoferrum sp.]|nr:hypothetical protein [Candidatus Acidoferrum sp.]
MDRPKILHPAMRSTIGSIGACEADPLPPYVEEIEPERGPPLTRSECDTARIALAAWQAPRDFIAATKALSDRCNSEDWFNRPHLKFLHDAYVLRNL